MPALCIVEIHTEKNMQNKILLVEDDTMIASGIVYALANEGYDVIHSNMGIIGFIAGVLYKKGLLLRSRTSLCIFGAICTFLIYGGIMNPASALIWGSETLNFKVILGYYITGFPMDAVHAAATVLFLWFGAEPMLEKLDRIKTKYGLVE